MRSLAAVLALNRTVGIVLISVLFFGLGEQLWERFLPVFLQAQAKQAALSADPAAGVSWAALWAIGLYGFLRNLFEGFCYIGGGQLTGRLGDRGSLLLFSLLTLAGYGLFLAAQWPLLTIAAALLVLGWEPLAVPVTFTTVGSTVAAGKQGMAFAVQSIQKRLPMIIGPAVAGFVLGAAQEHYGSEELGNLAGMRVLVGVALGLAVASLALQWRFMPHQPAAAAGPPSLAILRDLHPTLRGLLLAEVFTRWCDWLVRLFVVVYLIAVRGVSPETAGLLFAAMNLTSLLTYLPVGRLTETAGLQPFIGVTFIFFALFPLVLAVCPTEYLLVAFIVNGLREIGEPARKALITSLLPPEARARGVGLYWGVRSFAICTASLAGAWLWHAHGPETLLYAAFGAGCVGAALFYLLARCQPPGDDSKKPVAAARQAGDHGDG